MILPTTKQKEVLEFIREFIKVNSYPPSYAEIARRFEVQINVIQKHLDSMEKKGMIRRTKRVARSIVVLK